MSNVGDVKGLVVLVTGGASGLGEAIVARLIKHGAKVAIFDLPSSKGDKVASDLGSSCIFTAGDVTSEIDVVDALAKVRSNFDRLDVVVNCAGIVIHCDTYDFANDKPHSLEDFKRILNVNTVGTFNVSRLAIGLIAKNKPNRDGQRGVIVNISSIQALDGPMHRVAYSASKAAVVGMTLPLARELSVKGIRVCAIAPGGFDTPMMGTVPIEATQFTDRIPFPSRLGHPDELAHMVQAIIENPQMNGEVVRVDACYRCEFEAPNA